MSYNITVEKKNTRLETQKYSRNFRTWEVILSIKLESVQIKVKMVTNVEMRA